MMEERTGTKASMPLPPHVGAIGHAAVEALAIDQPASVSSENDAVDHGLVHLELVRVVERVYRRYLDLLRNDLTRLGVDDVSPSQVMMLFTIGTDDLSVRDLIDRGHYLGSNASYNLKRLVECGYVERSASPRDRRAARIRLSERGRNLCDLIRKIDETYHRLIVRDEAQSREFGVAFHMLRRLEHVWTNAVRYGEAGLV
jgi:DNA-binding MarR family transcriptional regulator